MNIIKETVKQNTWFLCSMVETQAKTCPNHLLLLNAVIKHGKNCRSGTSVFYREMCARGWLLLNLITGFFPCSSTLLPYVMRHLQSCSQDSSHPYRGTVFTTPSLFNHSERFHKYYIISRTILYG